MSVVRLRPPRRNLGVHATEMLRWIQRQERFVGTWAQFAQALHTTEVGAVNAALQVVEQKLMRVTLTGDEIVVTITERGKHRSRP